MLVVIIIHYCILTLVCIAGMVINRYDNALKRCFVACNLSAMPRKANTYATMTAVYVDAVGVSNLFALLVRPK